MTDLVDAARELAAYTDPSEVNRASPLVPEEKGMATWYVWPRKEHSAKPDAFYDLVEQVSQEPRIEMFSRRARLGWDTWGDEALHGTELVA